MIDNLFVISPTGEVLIEKQWRGKIKRTICELFWEEVTKAPSRAEVLPVLVTPKCYIIHVMRFGLYFMTCVSKEVQPLLVIEAQHRIVDVLVQYFPDSRLNETVLRENFSTVLQVLDEMIDGGFPSTTELNQLKEMIIPPSLAQRVLQSVTGEFALRDDLPMGVVSKIPWRKADVKYVTNEIYLDIVEQVDAIIASNGNPVSVHVYGDVRANSRLSAMPDCTLSFLKPAMLEDCALHRCVRINRFERERIVSFVPPDGAFTLMSYRIKGVTQLPLSVRPQITYKAGSGGRVHVSVQGKYTQQKPITDVVILIPLPKALKSSNITANVGTIKHDQITKLLRWEIGELTEEKSSPVLEGSVTLPPDFVPDETPTVTAEFTVKMFSVSGLKVDGLQVRGVKYKPFKGVRCVTQAGKFQIRC